jgi:hypothetical protein
MKRFLTTLVTFGLLIGLGVLAALARPQASSRADISAIGHGTILSIGTQSASPVIAPAATNKLNVIAMPLNAAQQFTAAGKNFDADGLASIVGAGVQQVLTWNAGSSGYRAWYPQDGEGDNFGLVVGGVYRLVVDSTAPSVVSFVGDVPAQGSVQFSLVRPTGAGCKINDISIPLNRSDISTADQLAISVGNVSQVLEWNAATQSYKAWYPQDGEGDNFATKIGFPYRLCLLSGGLTTWPTP